VPEQVIVEEKDSKWKIGRKAGLILLIGTVFVACFSDPMVETITRFASEVGISNFYVSFVVTPMASNASELIASLMFSARKRKRNSTLAFGAIYGAATMNNTMCLSIFLALVFARGLVWEFSAEVLSILFVTVVVGGIAATRTQLRTYLIFVVISLYPLSLLLVALLESYADWQ